MASCCRSTAAAWSAEFSCLQYQGFFIRNTTALLFNLSGRVALVTGSGQGMGLGAVRALCRQGVTANALSLGAMNNFGYDEIAKRNTAVGRAGTADDVGAALAYLVSSEASWMSGQVIALNGGSCTA